MENKSFEDALKELEMVVKNLENGNIPLEDAINYFTKGMELANYCNTKLKNVEEQVNKVLTKDNELVDFDIPEE